MITNYYLPHLLFTGGGSEGRGDVPPPPNTFSEGEVPTRSIKVRGKRKIREKGRNRKEKSKQVTKSSAMGQKPVSCRRGYPS